MKSIKNDGKLWWLYLVVGILAVVLGCFLVFAPSKTLVSLSFPLALLFMVSGVCGVVFSVKDREKLKSFVVIVISNVFLFVVGVLLLFKAQFVIDNLKIFLGVAFLLETVVLCSNGAERFKESILWGIIMIVVGVLLGAAAIAVLVEQISAQLIVAYIIAAAAFIFGASCVIMALQMKPRKNDDKLPTKQDVRDRKSDNRPDIRDSP